MGKREGGSVREREFRKKGGEQGEGTYRYTCVVISLLFWPFKLYSDLLFEMEYVLYLCV